MADKKRTGTPYGNSNTGKKNNSSEKSYHQNGKNQDEKGQSGKNQNGKNQNGKSQNGNHQNSNHQNGNHQNGNHQNSKSQSGKNPSGNKNYPGSKVPSENQNYQKNKNQSGQQNKSAKEQTYEEPILPVTEEEADNIRVTVDLEDGTSEECMILTIMSIGEQDYIALLPMDENDQPNAEGRVYLYRYFEDENGLPYMENIEDDDEYEAVFDAFDEWQDEELFDSMD